MGLQQAADLRDEAAVPGAAREHHLAAELVLDEVAHGRKPVGGPDPPRASGARMDEERPSTGAHVSPPVRDIGLARDKADLAGRDRDAGRAERLEVILADGLGLMLLGRIVRDVGVERPEQHEAQPISEYY